MKPETQPNDDRPAPGELIPLSTKGLVVQTFMTFAGMRRLDITVPDFTTFDKAFVFKPTAFLTDKATTREGEPLLIPDTVQRLGLYRYLCNPLAPVTYAVSSDLSETAEHFTLFLTTYWLHHWGTDLWPCRLLWITSEDSFRELHTKARSGALDGCRAVVVTGLRPEIPQEELWYLNGILSRFRAQQRFLCVTGQDAYSFCRIRLGLKPSALVHLRDPEWDSVKRMQRVEKAHVKRQTKSKETQ